jgi:high affinity sulfate transporter 1
MVVSRHGETCQTPETAPTLGHASLRARAGLIERITRIAPGVRTFATYRREYWRHDLMAGLSVAAVAVPVGVAYAQLAGFNAAVGLYSSILPLVAYALFGTSRQLIVGPDAATCTLVAAAIAPYAAAGTPEYLATSVTLAFIAGVLCIGASFLRLGALADFLSRPILAGFMNGISLYIVLGQMGKLLGFKVASSGIARPLIEVATRLGETHLPTLAVGAGAFVVLVVSPRLMPRMPAALVALALTAIVTKLFGLADLGVRTVGPVPAGLPAPVLPRVPLDTLEQILVDAAGVALITFCSAMLTARSFAAKNGYDLDDERELAAIGVANIVSSLSQGFAISGADSRTAVSDAAGGRTQLAALVAAAAIACVLIFLTGPLQYVPIPALGAVLVMTALSLVDTGTLKTLWREDRGEFFISLVATLGVVVLGSLRGILLAVVLALVRFIRLVARPSWEILGIVPGVAGLHSTESHPAAQSPPGLCLFRFNGPLVFFNARYFKVSALAAVATLERAPRWFVLDAVAITGIDATGRHTLMDLQRELAARSIRFVFAGRRSETPAWLSSGRLKDFGKEWQHFPTLRAAIQAFRAERDGTAGHLEGTSPGKVS